MELSELGEFGLIERLRAALRVEAGGELVVRSGDDAAVWANRGPATIATTDTMVEGVHFLAGAASWHDVGWKAIAVNVSDIAAMGGVPSFALVTLCLTSNTALSDLDELADGMNECAEAYGARIVGGDIVSAPVFAITVALMGDASVAEDGAVRLLRRDGARVGDAIAVTGPLGGAAGGLRVLQERPPRPDGGSPEGRLVAAHLRPRARVDAGKAAIVEGIACAIDISDGLVQDLGHVCRASGVEAEVFADDIPVAGELRDVFPEDALTLALTGGEDYELILVGHMEALERVGASLRRARSGDNAAGVTVIGRITGAGTGAVRVLDRAGAAVEVGPAGWDHLRGARQ